MARAKVFYSDRLAGIIEKEGGLYIFTYNPDYLANPESRSISLTLPKRIEPYESTALFPFFYGLLSEGSMKEIQCQNMKIDENDHFTRLIKTASHDTIGAITVAEIIS